MSFKLLKAEIDAGLKGNNRGIPMGFRRLNRYIGIRKRTMTLIYGPTGSGKSSFMWDAYILNPFDYMLAHPEDKINYSGILFAMERSKVYVLAKWLSRKIFISQGIHIPIQKMLGWWEDDKLTKHDTDLIDNYSWYIDQILEMVDIIEGPQNPYGIFKYVKDKALERGSIEEIDEFHKIYVPNDPNEIRFVAEDHLGNTKVEKGLKTKKEAIDKVSEHNQYFRDFLGYHVIPISQLTRNLNNPIYQKVDNFEPTIDDIKESGRPGEDSDVVLSLFEPLRYRTNDANYDAEKFRDGETGAKYFRKVKILKNTFGEDDIGSGLAFMGSIGAFKELPKPKDMENFDYESLFNGSYFLNE